jgi:hypothetical protein
MIRSCFFKRRFSETRALAPPGLYNFANVVRMWSKRRNRIFMAGELRKTDTLVQGEKMPHFKLKFLIRHAQEKRAVSIFSMDRSRRKFHVSYFSF